MKNISTKSTYSSINIITRRLSYFFRKGNKAARERLFRTFFKERAIKQSTSKNTKSFKISKLFKTFFFGATPFVALKTRRRRRGKRVIVKVIPLERSRGERKSLRALSSALKSQGASTKVFTERLNRFMRELETFNNSNNMLKRGQVKGKSKIKVQNTKQVAASNPVSSAVSSTSLPFQL